MASGRSASLFWTAVGLLLLLGLSRASAYGGDKGRKLLNYGEDDDGDKGRRLMSLALVQGKLGGSMSIWGITAPGLHSSAQLKFI